ncbi:hypothetical protein COZ60_02800 [Candidatus Bathyarchaeota archaeon CG_4_8_14_3_um_filter_42_8]|nr:MAG: hypothetical protein COZ60_02800 [Candidatus Bathyarchaeota archaeon CG_4_8_14_3_um_filter_42_8]
MIELIKYYNPGEIAKLFGVDRKTVTNWAQTGKIPNLRLPSGRFRFRKDEIDDILREKKPLEIRVPEKLVAHLQKAFKAEFGENISLEDGVIRVLQEHIKQEKLKRKKNRGGE